MTATPTCAALIAAAEEALELRRPPPLHRRKELLLLLVAAVLIAAFAGAAVVAVLATGGHAMPAAAPLFARENTVARVDPVSGVSAVIAVGATPVVTATGGHSVWVYNQGGSISEIDARTNRVRKTTPMAFPADVRRLAGPVLAANASGAWFVGGALGFYNRPLLTNVLSGGRGKRDYGLDVTPTGVAVGEGAVWVVGQGLDGYEVLRADPSTGRIEARTRFATSEPIDSIAVGYGAVWVVGSADATLYRIDPGTAKRTGQLVVGTSSASRPEIMPRDHEIWIRLAGGSGEITLIDPSPLRIHGHYPSGARGGGTRLGGGQRGPRRALVVHVADRQPVPPGGGLGRADSHDPPHEHSSGRRRAVPHLDRDRLGKPLADGCSVGDPRLHLPPRVGHALSAPSGPPQPRRPRLP